MARQQLPRVRPGSICGVSYRTPTSANSEWHTRQHDTCFPGAHAAVRDPGRAVRFLNLIYYK